LHYQDKRTIQFQIEVSIGSQPFFVQKEVTFSTMGATEDASIVGGRASKPRTLRISQLSLGGEAES
jgi:hypothetical protein